MIFFSFVLMFSRSFDCSGAKGPRAQLRGSVGFESGALLFGGDTLTHVLFDCCCQSLISGGETGRWAMSPLKFEILLIFPKS